MARQALLPQLRARGVTAVLGPTNTGKTHLAIERMLGHASGMIGLPLRLLAREVYSRVVEKAGAENVALVTGEEKIKPEGARYWVSTVEAMPRDLDLAFVAVDEIQLAADLDRGHVFTDRLLHQRGREETMLVGSLTVRPLIEALIPGVHVVTRPRLSQLTFAGEKKISRLPHRTAIVAFSAEEVYAIAELIRRQRGGAAVVLGALSPRTRNAQVDLYQSGDVDYLVATDAIGMGLNLDVDHVAFAADRKFDGFQFRKLNPAELGQIAGRAGRHLRDGTFGTTGRCSPFDPEMVDALENHRFDPVRVLQWRNADLDFSSLRALQDSLAEQPREPGLVRAPVGEDVAALDILARDREFRDYARGPKQVEQLWEVCQVPDYRKVSPASHADLVAELYRFLIREGRLPDEWFSGQVAGLDRTTGDIDTLSNRIAQVRTWTFVANRPDWLRDPEHWQGVTRQVEDRLSDALHERLASRFVDRRTSVLMRRLRENAIMEAEITATGDVTVEGQHVGHLRGFHFAPDPGADGTEAKALRNAAGKALAGEIEARADRFAAAADAALILSNDGTIRWTGDPVAKLEPGEKLFEPRFRLVADEQLTGPARDKVENRLKAWLKALVTRLLGPLISLESSAELTGLARGLAFQIAEAVGVLERSKVLLDVRSLDQEGRGALRRQGVRFGAYHLTVPALLKPGPRILAAQLWALKNGGLDQKGLDDIAVLAGSGRTSIPVDPEIAKGLYRAAGFRVCGGRAVRVDILERLADLIRPAIAYRPGITPGEPPSGAADGDGFVPTVGMTSLVGCSGEDFASILRSLGYVVDRRPGPAITVPLVPASAQPESAGAADPGADAVGIEGPDPASTGRDEGPGAAGTEATAEVAEALAVASGELGESAPVDDGVEPVATEALAAPVEDPGGDVVPVPASDVAVAGGAVTPAPESGHPLLAPSTGGPDLDPAAAGEAGALPAAEIVDAAAETDPSVTEGKAAEPVLIEVWRPHRHHRDGLHPRPARGRGAGPPRGREARADGEGFRQERPRRPERRGPPGEIQRAPQRPQGGAAATGSPARDDRPGRGRPDHGRPPWKDDRRRQDRRDNGADFRSEDRPRRDDRRERAPDPNSPFAKLLVLKAQLEGRKGDER